MKFYTEYDIYLKHKIMLKTDSAATSGGKGS